MDCYNLSVFEDNKKYDLSCDGVRFSALKENGVGAGSQNQSNFSFGGGGAFMNKSGKYAGLEDSNAASFNVNRKSFG